jgi:alpha-acetolactate decarboxylase
MIQHFSYIEARSVPAQKEPYPLLSEVTEEQTVFEYKDVTGTLVGYWCPEYLSGINLAGYPLHFYQTTIPWADIFWNVLSKAPPVPLIP